MGSIWQVSDALIERKLKNRDGSEGTIYYREMSERDSRKKMSKMISFGRKGDANSSRVDMEKYREFEMLASIVDWDLEDGDGGKLPLNAMTLALMPEYVTTQIVNHIKEINDLPEDEDDEENPTTEDSDEPYAAPSPAPHQEQPAAGSPTQTTTTGSSPAPSQPPVLSQV